MQLEALPIGLRRIIAERIEQIELHGYTPDRDNYIAGELSRAAMAYILFDQADDRRLVEVDGNIIVDPAFVATFAAAHWPWDASTFKPSRDPRKNLMKAGALIAADLDRLYRKESRNG